MVHRKVTHFYSQKKTISKKYYLKKLFQTIMELAWLTMRIRRARDVRVSSASPHISTLATDLSQKHRTPEHFS